MDVNNDDVDTMAKEAGKNYFKEAGKNYFTVERWLCSGEYSSFRENWIVAFKAGHASRDAEVEILRMQLVGCGVAALQNTIETRRQRITKDNSYWSRSYGDVCDVVDREIELRDKLTQAEAKLEKAKDMLEDIYGVRCSECDGGEHIIEQIREVLAELSATEVKP